MGRIVQKRRLSSFEQPMPDNLQTDAHDNQNSRDRPHGTDTYVADDDGRSRKQKNRGANDPHPESGIEQQPVNQNGQDHHGSHRGLDAKYLDRPEIEGENSGQEQKYDPEHMHHAVPPIAVILDVIRKLAPKIRIHTEFATNLACGTSRSPGRRNQVAPHITQFLGYLKLGIGPKSKDGPAFVVRRSGQDHDRQMTIAPVIRLTLSNLSVVLNWDDTRQGRPSSIFIPLPRHVVARRSRSPLAVRACASGGDRSGRDKYRSPA